MMRDRTNCLILNTAMLKHEVQTDLAAHFLSKPEVIPADPIPAIATDHPNIGRARVKKWPLLRGKPHPPIIGVWEHHHAKPH
jgi:hypothetical protein